MAVFVDTSGFFALLAREDANYARAQAAWQALVDSGERLISHSYVISETFALVQRRLGLEALVMLQNLLEDVVQIVWVDGELHEAAVKALLTARSRAISLVDYVSFELMARRGITVAFAYDDDFRRAGFTLAS